MLKSRSVGMLLALPLLLAFSAPLLSQAQGSGLDLMMSAQLAACGHKECPPPSDPLQRQGFVLRLSSAMHLPLGGALPGLAPRLPSGAIDGNRVTEQTEAERAARQLDPLMLNATGVFHASEGRYEQAQAQLEAALRASANGRDAQVAAASAANLGVVAAGRGRYDEARSRLEAALAAYRSHQAEPRPPAGGAAAVAAPAMPAWMQRALPQVQAQVQSQLAGLAREQEAAAARTGVLRTLLNLANLAAHIGRYADAEQHLKAALERVGEQPGRAGERLVLREFWALYRQAGRLELAADHRRRAERAAPLPENWAALEPGAVALGSEATTAGAAPSATASPGRPGAEPPAAAGTARMAEAAHRRLVEHAAAREAAADRVGARAAHSSAALLALAQDSPERERVALSALARLHAADGQADEAIFHGKRAVNAVQRLRQSLDMLDRPARQAFLADKRRSYVLLTQGLLDRQRLPEAEQVLRLLKEDEGQQFRDPLGRARPAGAGEERGRIAYGAAEARALAAYQQLGQRAKALESERSGLRGTPGAYEQLAPEARAEIERARRAELSGLERWAAMFDEVTAQAPRNMRRELDIAARPAAARSAEEARALADFVHTARLFERQRADAAAALRAFERDALDFAQPLTTAEAGRVQATRTTLTRIEAQLKPLLQAILREPQTTAGEMPRFLALVLGNADPKLRRLWSIDRELEALEQEQQRLDASLSPMLSAGAGAFTGDETALLAGGRQLLSALPQGTVALYYLGGDTRLDILLVSRAGHRAWRLPLERAALEQRIKAYRVVLQDPRRDPQPLARELYQWLLAPVAQALEEARAQTLMLALDGPLRYLPFAALHDGQTWVAERHAVTLYTTAAPAALAKTPQPRWRVAAFGATAGGQGMSPLPGVKVELEGIVRDAALGTTGVLPGAIRMDRAFTAASLQAALRERAPVVHIASHFAFTGGDAASSFLLLGDGGRLTLEQLSAPAFRFDDVDLVTLSACETALAGDDRFGQEVEGLGTLLQGQGAAAVLATLWPVDDDSTAVFMRRLYGAREGLSLSRAQALRAAQLALLRGSAGALAGELRGATRPGTGAPVASPEARPYAHPFYWAPFTLMGNWL